MVQAHKWQIINSVGMLLCGHILPVPKDQGFPWADYTGTLNKHVYIHEESNEYRESAFGSYCAALHGMAILSVYIYLYVHRMCNVCA